MGCLLAVMLMASLSALPQAARAQSAYTTYSRYDAFERLTGVIHPVLPAGTYQAERLTYDARGNVTLKGITVTVAITPKPKFSALTLERTGVIATVTVMRHVR